MPNYVKVCFGLVLIAAPAWSYECEASYYTRASCAREGTSGIMANRKVLNDNAYTCASWDFALGQRLRITTRDGHSIVVVVSDRGPSKRLYRLGRRLDLSQKAFNQLAPLERGIIHVNVTEVSDAKEI